ERVRAVVSLDGGPTEAAATPGFRRAMRFAFLIKLFGGTRRLEGIVRSTLAERSADPRWVTDEVVAGYMSAGARDLDGTLTALRQIAKVREPEALLAAALRGALSRPSRDRNRGPRRRHQSGRDRAAPGAPASLLDR